VFFAPEKGELALPEVLSSVKTTVLYRSTTTKMAD